ncbi:MAG: hypothetical protein QXL52_01545 [Nitrososphaerales archaeon]
MTTKVSVNPGACKRNVIIYANKLNSKVILNIESDCPSVVELSKKISEISIKEMAKRMDNNIVYKAASEAKLHPTCPVPLAILKAIEAEFGLALKKDVKILFMD